VPLPQLSAYKHRWRRSAESVRLAVVLVVVLVVVVVEATLARPAASVLLYHSLVHSRLDG